MDITDLVNGKKWIAEGVTEIQDATLAWAVSFIYTHPNALDKQEGLHHPNHDIELCKEEIGMVHWDDNTSEIKEPSYFLTDDSIKELIYGVGVEKWRPYSEKSLLLG